MSFDSENLIALVLINNICRSKNKNRKSQNIKLSECNLGWKTGAAKVHMSIYFQNLCELKRRISSLFSNEYYMNTK